MNPYAVGYTGATMTDHTATCDCCEIEFTFKAPADRGSDRTRCDYCASHNLDGSANQQLLSLREHQARYPALIVTARRITREAKAEQRRAEEEVKWSRRQVAEALRSRDRHRAIHEAAMAVHYPVDSGGCQCGEKYPCPTREAANEARSRVGDPEELFQTWP
jgi:hypothetical protein